MHVTPGHAFEEAILCQDANVLREIGVINPAGAQVQHFGGEQCGQTNRPRRADDDLGKFFALNVVEHLQNGRETELLQLVLGQLEFADRLEILNRDIVDL